MRELDERCVPAKTKKVKVSEEYGLLCKITYKEFCQMKLTNPNWKGG